MKKELLDRKYKQTGYNNGFTKIGFVFDNLAASQATFFCIKSSNEWLDNNFGLNISLFFEEDALPCLEPNFARFHVKDIFTFGGIIIATSPQALIQTDAIKNCRKFFYIQDLDSFRPWFDQIKKDYEKIMNDKSIIKFCRSKDHRDYLISRGYDIHNTIVEDFDINKILEIINEKK